MSDIGDTAALGEMDRKVHDWLEAKLGPVTAFTRHPRWRPGWDVVVERDGVPLPLYIRGPRGDTYVSPVDMHQEAGIHRVYAANGIPAPRLVGLIDDPLSIVLERLPGTINVSTVDDDDTRRRILDDYVAIVARVHQLPLAAFAEIGLPVPETPEEIALALYTPAIAIFDRTIGRPFPLMRFVERWLHRNVPQDRTRAAFVNFDAGQFMFEGDRVTGLIDFEVSAFGDPAAELAGLRIRNTAEPMGDISALIDRYEALTGDRIDKRLIEYHTAGFCGVNGFLLWPLAFDSAPEQDYVAYLQFAVAGSRYAIRAIADHGGMALADPAMPAARPIGFAQAGAHLARQIAALPGETKADAYARDSIAALARYQQRWAEYGPAVLEADLADAAALLGRAVADWDEAQAAVEAFVVAAGPQEDAALAQYFHNWLTRQDFLLRDCGPSYAYHGIDLQPIPPRGG